MKNYDFKKARLLIEQNKENLASASLGMHEDWFWTAQIVWEGGEYKHPLPDNADEMQAKLIENRMAGMSIFSADFDKYSTHTIMGIYGSDWATPTLELVLTDGTERMIACHDNGDSGERAGRAVLGCLSGPVQDNITPIE